MTFEAKFYGLVFGVIPICIGIWQFARETAPGRWRRVSGTIISSTVKFVSSGRESRTIPVVAYQYSCDGRTFETDRRRVSNFSTGLPDYAEKICARYRAGSSVTVLVNPRKPELAVLEYGSSPLSWVPICVGILVLCLMVFVK